MQDFSKSRSRFKLDLGTLALLAAALATGCAMGAKTYGYPFDLEACEALVEGVTTEDDALSAIGGTPTNQNRQPDGAVVVSWDYRKTAAMGFWRSTARAFSYVPLLGLPFRLAGAGRAGPHGGRQRFVDVATAWFAADGPTTPAAGGDVR